MTADADLDSLIAAVAARWPELRVEPAELAIGLEARGLGAGAAVAIDVALACALAAGDRGALQVFERELVPDVRGALVRLDRSGDLVEEALQQLREKLLVASGTPRIAEYRGRGSLAAWIQVIAIREALMLRRRTRRDQPVGEEALLLAVESDPALALTKRTYRTEFADAFRVALAALTTRDRTLLRMCFVDTVGTERLAALYQVHRVTMFRWLSEARAHLLDGIRAALIERTGIAASEVDSVIRAVASSLDISW